MITKDLKIAVRHILRNKVQSAISIIGLGIGLGCIILLMALIVHEKSFDKFIPGHENVCRILIGNRSFTPFPLAEELKKDFPEVKGFFRFYQTNNIQLRNPQNDLVRDRYFGFSDSSIFRILGIKLIAGTPPASISEVAISERTAAKYYKGGSPVGTILPVKLNDTIYNLSISGIYENFPSTSTLFPEYIADIKLSETMFRQFRKSLGDYGGGINTAFNWDNPSFFTYVLLADYTDRNALTGKMSKYLDLTKDEKTKELKYSLQPVTDIYQGSGGLDNGREFFRTGNINELKYYWSISFLILLISVTNYIFLTRAATSDRLRELGTRKVLGASHGILRNQIIFESSLVTFLSLIPASFVIDSGMDFINNTLNRTMSKEVFTNPVMWLLLISVVIFTGTLSGYIIGFNISRIPSLVLLTGKTSENSRSKRWDYSFLIFHFSIYIILVVSVIAVSKQIKYSMTGYKGINPRNVIVSDLNTNELKSAFTSICDEMGRIPGVTRVAGGSYIPPFGNYLPLTLKIAEGERTRFDGLIMGEGMTELLDIEVIDGSPFGPYKPQPLELLINESSARKYNLKAGDNFMNAFQIIGIVRDFHAHSLHTLIQPMAILQQNPSKMNLIAIRTTGSNDKAIIGRLRELYNQISPDEIFEVRYLTDEIANFYRYERNQAKIIGAFSFLATVLAIMGLFGIALISIARKTKEIGLRKVNGASVAEVMYLLNKGFVKWILAALVIGIPVSYYLLAEWQNRFAYKTELSWWIFALAGISAVLVAVLTVSWQTWRAATRNPVEALRYE